jgi:hypothetical protein
VRVIINKRILVFISSPYTIGDVAVNVRRQIDIKAELEQAGFLVFAPLMSHFEHLIYPREYNKWLDIDFQWILRSDCILRLDGVSAGSDLECKFAKDNYVKVFIDKGELIEYYTRTNL